MRNREARRSTPDDAEVDNEDGVRWNTTTVAQHSIDRKMCRRSGTTPLPTALPSLKEAADGSGRNLHIGVMTTVEVTNPSVSEEGPSSKWAERWVTRSASKWSTVPASLPSSAPRRRMGGVEGRALHTTLTGTVYRMANLTFADALGVSGGPASDGGRTRIWLNPQLPPAQGR